MKRTVLTAMAIAVSFAVASPGVAADKEMKDRRASDRPAFTLDAAHMDSKEVLGMRVEYPDGKRAGKIDHLIFEKDGKITHAVISTGGMAGVGRKEVVVAWSQVRIRKDPDGKKNVAMMDAATLDSAPRYMRRADRTPAASPATAPAADRDKDGTPNRTDRAPSNPNKQ